MATMEEEQAGAELEGTELEGTSLQKRLRRHRAELDRYQTETFPVPRWGQLVHVELGVVSYRRLARIADSHKRVRDEATRNLYIGADALLAATVGFREVHGDALEPVDIDWVKFARAAYPELDPGTLPRVALIKVIGDDLLPEFVQEWRDWNRERGEDTDTEIAADLGATRS